MADTPNPSTPDSSTEAAPDPGPEVTAAESPACEPSAATDGTSPEPAAPDSPPEPTPAAEPPATKPEAAAEAEPPAADQPSVAATLIAAPTRVGDEPSADGGEWELLLEKLSGWWRSGRLRQQLAASRKPITLVASLIALLLVLRVYSAVLGAIDSLPLVPGLLELVGLIALVQFSFTRLVRSRERQQLITGMRQRWRDFSGGAG